MQWTTRAQLHLDRTASAWLIRRFVDPQADFVFIGWDQPANAEDPRYFGMPGIELSSHDEDGTCFEKILRLQVHPDAGLNKLARCVRAGVRHALAFEREEEDESIFAVGLTLDALGVGLALDHEDDQAHLHAATPLYDALYAYLSLPDLSTFELPNTQPERHTFLRSLIS